jgi:glycosyltransferase involved in cell wall biosynthesis
VILEAMALGKAVVASRFPRSEELITDGETGLLVQAEDKAQLARQTQKLLTDAGLRERLGEAARRRAEERHRPEELAETCVRLYRG